MAAFCNVDFPQILISPLQVMKPEDFQKRWLPAILEAQAATRKLPGNSALVTGAAVGLGCMLGAPGLLPGFPQEIRGPSYGNPKVIHAALKVLSNPLDYPLYVKSRIVASSRDKACHRS